MKCEAQEYISAHVYGSKSAQKSYKRTGLSDGRQSAGVGARDRFAGNLSLKKPPKTDRHRFTFPIRTSDSCRKLLTAEVWTIRACTAVSESCTVSFNGRDRPTDQRLVYGKSTRMLGSFLPFHSLKSVQCKSRTFHFIQSVLSFHSPRRVELNTWCSIHSTHLVESRTVQIVFSSILQTLSTSILYTLY